MRLFRIWFALCFCAWAGGLVPAASGQDARALLEKVSAKYASLENYYFTGTFRVRSEMMGQAQEVEAPFVMAGKPPGKSRMEIRHEALGTQVVCDGEATWSYFAAFNQYKKEFAVPLEPEKGGGKQGREGGVVPTAVGSFVALYTALDDDFRPHRRIGDASVAFGGRDVECAVIEIAATDADSAGSSLGPDTVWVDPDRAVVLRSKHVTTMASQGMTVRTCMTLEYDEIRIREPPPDSLFAFTPPAGAELVDEYTMGGSPATDMTGRTAASFRLPGLGGQTWRSDRLRGKVVLLDFWATWCRPCREELPAIEKLHREFRDEGLVVLAITAEPEGVAEAFVEKYGYTFPVLIDQKQAVFGEYAVKSIPVVVVIDRGGTIAAHFVGLRGEEELRAALQKAGIQ